MSKKSDTIFIQIVHPVCCGLGVHKKKISASKQNISPVNDQGICSHSIGSLLFFLLLHFLQAGTTFPFVLFPPRETGTM